VKIPDQVRDDISRKYYLNNENLLIFVLELVGIYSDGRSDEN